MMNVIDAILDSFSNLFRSHRYSPLEKIYFVLFFIAGQLREVKEDVEELRKELVTAISATHNIIRAGGEEVIPTFQPLRGGG
jgi:hypothetical protein